MGFRRPNDLATILAGVQQGVSAFGAGRDRSLQAELNRQKLAAQQQQFTSQQGIAEADLKLKQDAAGLQDLSALKTTLTPAQQERYKDLNFKEVPAGLADVLRKEVVTGGGVVPQDKATLVRFKKTFDGLNAPPDMTNPQLINSISNQSRKKRLAFESDRRAGISGGQLTLAQQRERRQKTEKPEALLVVESAVGKMNRLGEIARVLEQIPTGPIEALTSRGEILLGKFGIRKPSKAAIQFEELRNVMDSTNIIEVFEKGGKQLTATEKQIVQRDQIQPGDSREQILAKIRSISGVLRNATLRHIRATRVKTPFGFEGSSKMVIASFKDLESIVGPGIFKKGPKGAGASGSKQRQLDEINRQLRELDGK